MKMHWAKRSPVTLLVLSILCAVSAMIFDIYTPTGVADGAVYIVLVVLGLWAPWWYFIFIMAGLASLLTVIGHFLSPDGAVPIYGLINRGLTLLVIWTVAIVGSIVKRNQARFHTAIDNAFDGIINIDAGGTIESFNKGAQMIFGYSMEEVIGQNISILMPPEHKNQHAGYITRYLRSSDAKVIGKRNIFTARHRNGTIFPVELSVSESEYGGQLTFIGIVRDITQRLKTEEQLLVLSSAIEQCPVSIVITDTEGSIEYVNPRFTETSGYSYQEVIGQNTRILKSLESRPDEYRTLWKTITSGGEWRGLFHNRKKTGETFWESAAVSPIKNRDGQITHYLSIKQDITEQLETEKQLAHALKLEATGQLTSGIAHDFNNLLTIISGNLQLIMDDNSDIDEPELNDILKDVQSAARDGEELIQRLLLLLRKNKPEATHVTVNYVISDLKKVLARMLGEDINVSIMLDETATTIFTDPHQLESALLNLAVNARDAMPYGGEFSIQTSCLKVSEMDAAGSGIKPGKYIAIEVRDNGMGMEAQVLARAREPFFTTKAEGKGSGLGLSMVSNFAGQSGGDLKIESAPGAGTIIRLLLPESVPLAGDPSPRQLPEHLPRGSETILVVEDNHNVRRFAVRSLKNLGYEVLETDNSDQAMALLNSGAGVDLLFSDIFIPGARDGHELARWARNQYPGFKILLTTGMRSELFDEQAILDDHLQLLKKPYTLEKLAWSVRKQLDSQ